MSFDIDSKKSFTDLAEALLKSFASLKANDLRQQQRLLKELNQAIFNDINAAENLLARLDYWLSVLVSLQEQGNALLVGAVYRNLERVFATKALQDLQSYLPEHDQALLQSLSIRYPRPEDQTQFVMEGFETAEEIEFKLPTFKPAESCQEQFKKIKADAELARAVQAHQLFLERQAQRNEFNSGSLSPRRSLVDSYSSQVSLASNGSSHTTRSATARAAVSLQRQERQLDIEHENKVKVEYFKGVYTALRAKQSFSFGNFLNNLKSTDSYLTQLNTIKIHVHAAQPRLIMPPSVTAWGKVQSCKPSQVPEEAPLGKQVTAFLVIYDYLRRYERGSTNFAAQLKELSPLAQWAAIEHHVLANSKSRSTRAWAFAQKAAKLGLPFATEINGKGSELLDLKTRTWLLSDVFGKVHPVNGYGKPMLSVQHNSSGPPLKKPMGVVVNGCQYIQK